MNLPLAPGEIVTGATLTFSNIWDSSGDPNNVIFIHLLDTPPVLDKGHGQGVKSLFLTTGG
jgi:hypothetical protein